MDTSNLFQIYVTGQIVSARFPLGSDGSDIFLKYKLSYGPDWEFVSGLNEGLTQTSSATGRGNDIVFNMPIEFVLRSTCPFGWPQLVISIYGKNIWKTITSLGYSRIHVPICSNNHRNIITSPIIVPKGTHLITDMVNWISGKNPELKNPHILVKGDKNKGLKMEAYGDLILSLQTISRGCSKIGYHCNRKD